MLFFSRKSVSLSCISFSKILSKFDESNMGLSLEKSNLDSFLCTGMSFAVLRFVGKTPVVVHKFFEDFV